MRVCNSKAIASLATVVLVLAACGGGGSGQPTTSGAAGAGSTPSIPAPSAAASQPTGADGSSTEAASSPLAVGGSHVCVLPGDGTVLCWGDNTFGQLGDGQVTDPNAPAGDVLALQRVLAEGGSAGPGSCTDLADDGSVVECQAGPPLTGVVSIAAGYSHTCALRIDGTVRCWGSNVAIDGGTFSPSASGGELGNGTTAASAVPVTVIAGPGQTAPLTGVRALSAATGYTCALMTDSSARCWGNAPQAVGDAPIAVMADAGHPLTGILSISAGDRHACALVTGGSVVCWGRNIEDSLGDGGSEVDSAFPVAVLGAGGSAARLSGATALSLGHNIAIGQNAIAYGHACVIDAASLPGSVHCWGVNDNSELGNGTSGGWLVDSAAGSSDPLSGAMDLAAGNLFTCALINDGSVHCWGANYGGPLEGVGAPVIAVPASQKAVAIAAGGSFCAVLADRSLWCLDFDGNTGMVPVPGLVIEAAAP